MLVVVLLLSLCLLSAGVAQASLFGGEKDDPLSKAEAGAHFLLKMLKDPAMQFDPQQVADLVAFAGRTHSNPADVKPESVDGSTGAYWEFNLGLPLQTLISYVFNPGIPPEAIYPSNVRLGAWHDEDKVKSQLGDYWNKLPDLTEPMVFRGAEYEETTPDGNSGCYYRYDLDRLLIMYKNNGVDTFLSVSRMQKPSGIGKMGVAVGAAADWNFFYSGKEGNLLPGLGWADSYMYDSITVYVFQQPDPQKPMTKVGLFKWVNGGWKSVNMVKHKHVVKGCQNVASIMRQVLQSDAKPTPEGIEQEVQKINAIPEQELRTRFAPMAKMIEEDAAKNKKLGRDDFAEIIKDGNYTNTLSLEELRSEFIKDFIRAKIQGKALFAQ